MNPWTSNVVEQCLNQLAKLAKPFKYIGKFNVVCMSFAIFVNCIAATTTTTPV